MRRKWLWLLIPVFIFGLYLAGPSPSTPVYDTLMPQVPTSPAALEQYVSAMESQHKLKPDNQARIVWAGGDSLKQKTPYSLVYLHGFSASQAEGDPVHRNIAREFGCNLYLSRLAEHGIDTADQLVNLTADNLWESSKQALAIGRSLGEKVILIGTSTGGTLALKLAATYPDKVAGLILLSPNIKIFDPKAWILNNHWGLQVARKIKAGNYYVSADQGPLDRQYWNGTYRLEALTNLEELLETSMNEKTFSAIRQPTLLLYYYKDEVHQDSTVSVAAALDMFDKLGTDSALKQKKDIPQAGNHVIGSFIKSRDVEGVQHAVETFMVTVMKMKPRP